MIKKTLSLAIFPLLISATDLHAAAMTCTDPSGSCAKFEIPGAFPGNFFIDFTHTSFNWAIIKPTTPELLEEDPSLGSTYTFMEGAGSLSTDSVINFSVGNQLENGDHALSVAPEGFVFKDLFYGADSSTKLGLYAIGTGSGTINSVSGGWNLTLPTLLVINQINRYITGNLTFSTSNPGGSDMILDNTDANWGALTIATDGGPMSAPTNVDSLLLSKILGNYSRNIRQLPREELYLDFKIQGVDPVSEVPLPASAWLLGSGLFGLASIARRKK